MTTTLPADVQRALAATAGRAFSHLFLVACGGSLVRHDGRQILRRPSQRHAGLRYLQWRTSSCAAIPARLGPDALVILCSQTGTTKETVRAARHAKARGATTIGMTLDPQSPLAEAVDHTVAYQASYTTGKPIDAAYSNYGVLYMLLAGFIDAREEAGPHR